MKMSLKKPSIRSIPYKDRIVIITVLKYEVGLTDEREDKQNIHKNLVWIG